MNDDEINEILKANVPQGIVSHYVVIYETYDEYGAELHVATSEATTPWLAMGMVDSAQDIIQMGQVNYSSPLSDFDDDEDYE